MEESFLGGYIPYCETPRWIRRWQFMERLGRRWWPIGGAVYVIRAVKRVSGMRMLGLDWSQMQHRHQGRPVATNQSHRDQLGDVDNEQTSGRHLNRWCLPGH